MKENNFYLLYSQKKRISESFNSGFLFENQFEIKGVNDFVDRIVSTNNTDSVDKKINIIASAILKKRNELKLTQEEVCKDICSISYISNLEANKYIKINNGFIYRICERLSIDYSDLESINPKLIIANTYKQYINNKIDMIDHMFNNLQETIDVPCENLFRAFYYLIHNEIEAFSEIMKRIDDIKKTLTKDEVVFMLYIMVIYFIKNMMFKKAYAYLGLIKRFDLNDDNLKALVQEACFFTYGNLIKDSEKYQLIKLQGFYDGVYPIRRQVLAKLQALIYQPEGMIDNIEGLEKEFVDNSDKEKYYYTLAYVYIMNKHYLEGIEVIIDSNITSIKMLNLLGLGIIYLKNDNTNVPIEVIKGYKHRFNDLCKKINPDVYDKLHITFLELLKYDLDGADLKFICDYIKFRVLPVYEEMQYMPYLNYIESRYFYLLGKLSRYKDAYNYFMDNQNKLKNNDFYYIINSIKE